MSGIECEECGNKFVVIRTEVGTKYERYFHVYNDI